jgi:3-methyladenine DNA glycosylase Tag
VPRRTYGAPKQIDAKTPGDYLEVITRSAFQAGISWDVINAKWDGFREAFDGFDAEKISEYTPDDIDRLAADKRIVRNRRKIEATVHNAQVLCDLTMEYGSVKAYLDSLDGFEAKVKDLRKRFKFLGDFGAYLFLYIVREPVPDYHEFRASRAEKRPARG